MIAGSLVILAAVLVLLYAAIIVFDKSPITAYEQKILKIAFMVSLACVAIGYAIIVMSPVKPKDSKPEVQIKHDTLAIHDTTVKYIRTKVTEAVTESRQSAAQAEARTPQFLERFDAR